MTTGECQRVLIPGGKDMNRYVLSSLLAILAFSIPLAAIFVSIYSVAWFSWWENALSDLGHAIKSEVAPIFNWGLLTGGILLILHATLFLRLKYPLTSWGLIASGYFLALIATFDEVYGRLHFIVSLAFFLSLAFSGILFAHERRSKFPLLAPLVIAVSWGVIAAGLCECGVAVPEIISVFATLPWYIEAVRDVGRLLKWEGQ